MTGSAIISPCGTFRYTLERTLGGGCGNVLFVMLNPSTADGLTDDPTIRRCMSFARRWDYGGLLVANLYAYRATNPKELTHQQEQCGPEWEKHTAQLANRAGRIVAAWGSFASSQRQDYVLSFLRMYGVVHCLGKTKDGSPRHPLYVRGDTPLTEFA